MEDKSHASGDDMIGTPPYNIFPDSLGKSFSNNATLCRSPLSTFGKIMHALRVLSADQPAID